MRKRFQNRVAESRIMLPAVSIYGLGVWLLCGLIGQKWWIQFACFVLSASLMAVINNQNVLIRIYSRSVSAAFIILSCAACFLFPSINGSIVQLCLVASMLTIQCIYHHYYSFCKISHSLSSLMTLGVAFPAKTRTFLPFR